MDKHGLSSHLAFAIKTAQKAGDALIACKSSAKIATYKGDDLTDFSTTADMTSESLIVESIRSQYPTYDILSEESFAAHSRTHELRWVIDPLDGTWEYARGGDNYATLISLENETDVLVAVAYFPQRNMLISSQKKGGVFINSRPVRTSKVATNNHALGMLRMPNGSITPKDLAQFQAIQTTLIRSLLRVKALPADIEAALYVASGQADVFIIPSFLTGYTGPKWWDIASGALFVSEGGGSVSDVDGNPLLPGNLSKGMLLSNGPLHTDLVTILKNARKGV